MSDFRFFTSMPEPADERDEALLDAAENEEQAESGAVVVDDVRLGVELS